MFEKILLAVDGSDHARKAVPVAIDIAKKSSGEVLVFHVREHLVARGGSYELEEAEAASALAGGIEAEIKAAGVQTSCRLERALAGHVAQAILDAAESGGADLIVMGSRGLSDLRGLLLGSVAHKVIQLADRPVLVAR